MEAMKSKVYQLLDKSNPTKAQVNAHRYLGKTAHIYPSPMKYKKYRIKDETNNKWVDFGDIRYEDYTKHQNESRRKAYLKRATNINGDWRSNPYSANNLAINILW
jgi:lipocalin